MRQLYQITLISFLFIFPAIAQKKSSNPISLKVGTSELEIGGRLQGITDYNVSSGANDLFLRRARVNLKYKTNQNHLISLDLRNDDSNASNDGNGNLEIGDAFYEIPLQDFGLIKNITFFRAKVDVSYSQTASSKDLIHPERESSSDLAANFIVHNRRATNVQLNGENDWMNFQIAVADGVQSDDLDVPFGNTTLSSIKKQSVTIGGKIRFYFWNPNKEKPSPQETFYKEMETFSLGVGYFANPKVTYQLSNGSNLSHSRQLYNLEASFAFRKIRLLGEAFLFEGDTINLTQVNIGRSHGGYLRGEYLIGKVAPYFGLNYLKRDSKDSQSYERSQLVGINYYKNGASERYGISFQVLDYANSLKNKDQKKIMTYLLFDY